MHPIRHPLRPRPAPTLRRRWYWLLLVVAQIALISPADAAAQARGTVDVEGDCPSRAALLRALRGTVITDPNGPFHLSLRREGERLRLDLVGDADTPALTRRLSPDSCAALAEAFAVIVHAHLLELRIIDELPAADLPAAEDAASATTTDRANTSAREHGAAQGNSGAAGTEPGTTSGGPSPPMTFGLRLWGGLSIAPLLAGVGVGLGTTFWPVDGFGLRCELDVGLHQPQASDIGLVTMREGRATLVALHRFGADDLHGLVGLSVGAWALSVTADGQAGEPTVLRWHPTVGARIEAGLDLGAYAFTSLGLAVDLAPWGDRFVAPPLGVIARSPAVTTRLVLALGLGF